MKPCRRLSRITRENGTADTSYSFGRDTSKDIRSTARTRIAAASIDYVLILAIIVPLATLLFLVVPRMIKLVYEMTITLIGSPLM